MRDIFVNIGNKTFVNVDKVNYIISADAEKVRRELAKRNQMRSSEEVFDGTATRETRAMLIFNDNTAGISCVSATVLAARANRLANEVSENETQTRITMEERFRTRNTFLP